MKSLIALVAAIATVLLMSACSSPAPTAQSPAQNNSADVTFVTGMIPHHQQAVELAAMVPQRSTDPAVIKLAAEISAAQGPEITTMKAMLGQWNVTNDVGHDGMQMQGMVDDPTMTKLATLRGAEFDKLWLQSMIGHHEGAIAMAKTEIADGANADAKSLAQQIATTQQAEIDQMKRMVGA